MTRRPPFAHPRTRSASSPHSPTTAPPSATFSPAYQVSDLDADASAPAALRSLASELLALSRIQHTFGEVEDLRRVLAAFTRASAAAAAANTHAAAANTQAAVAQPDGSSSDVGTPTVRAPVGRDAAGDVPGWFHSCCGLLVELLFLDNSRPLHRTLLAAAQRLPQQHMGEGAGRGPGG